MRIEYKANNIEVITMGAGMRDPHNTCPQHPPREPDVPRSILEFDISMSGFQWFVLRSGGQVG